MMTSLKESVRRVLGLLFHSHIGVDSFAVTEMETQIEKRMLKSVLSKSFLLSLLLKRGGEMARGVVDAQRFAVGHRLLVSFFVGPLADTKNRYAVISCFQELLELAFEERNCVV